MDAPFLHKPLASVRRHRIADSRAHLLGTLFSVVALLGVQPAAAAYYYPETVWLDDGPRPE